MVRNRLNSTEMKIQDNEKLKLFNEAKIKAKFISDVMEEAHCFFFPNIHNSSQAV